MGKTQKRLPKTAPSGSAYHPGKMGFPLVLEGDSLDCAWQLPSSLPKATLKQSKIRTWCQTEVRAAISVQCCRSANSSPGQRQSSANQKNRRPQRAHRVFLCELCGLLFKLLRSTNLTKTHETACRKILLRPCLALAFEANVKCGRKRTEGMAKSKAHWPEQ